MLGSSAASWAWRRRAWQQCRQLGSAQACCFPPPHLPISPSAMPLTCFSSLFPCPDSWQLMAPIPPTAARPSAVAGFPFRAQPLNVPGFATELAQGIQGADFACSGSVLPDKCAYRSPLDAATICAWVAQCRSVTVYSRGGCTAAVGWSGCQQNGRQNGCCRTLGLCCFDTRATECGTELR